MDHVAIDLGAKKSQICVRSADGRILEEKRWPTRDLERYLAGRPTSRVVVETCAEAFCVADAARKLGHEARVVPATLVKTLGVGARRLKTDQRDARALSEVSCRIELPSVHIPRTESRDRKSMCGMREALVGARTKVINTVRGWLRSRGRRIETILRFSSAVYLRRRPGRAGEITSTSGLVPSSILAPIGSGLGGPVLQGATPHTIRFDEIVNGQI